MFKIVDCLCFLLLFREITSPVLLPLPRLQDWILLYLSRDIWDPLCPVTVIIGLLSDQSVKVFAKVLAGEMGKNLLRSGWTLSHIRC